MRTPLLAGYFFAEAKAAKYLSQFLPCHIALINQLPAHLLVGPAAPTAHAPSYPYRYSKEMFSLARPQFAEPPPESLRKVDDLLSAGGKTSASTSNVRALATKPLQPTGQPKNERLDFFGAGLLIGASMTLSVAVPLLGYAAWTLGRKGLEYSMRFRR